MFLIGSITGVTAGQAIMHLNVRWSLRGHLRQLLTGTFHDTLPTHQAYTLTCPLPQDGKV